VITHNQRHVSCLLFMLSFALCTATARGATPKLNIETRHGTPREEKKKQQIERLAQQYDLSKWTLTRHIIIEQGVRPHSFPVLTLNPSFLNNDDLTLSVYVHEQAHWVLMARGKMQNRNLLFDLRREVPRLPIAYPEGSGDVPGTYFHLAVILLEWQGLEELIGVERARAAIDQIKTDHYTAIYPAVIQHRKGLEKILRRHSISW